MSVLLGIAAFVLGSVHTGLLIARVKGIDLRSVGSGNIGATNVLRAAGKLPALATLLGDAAKGAIPVWAAHLLGCDILAKGLIGVMAVLGHNFSIFLKFRGGKGVATSLGVLAAYAPLPALFTAIIWLITAVLSRYSSLGALVSFSAMPLLVALLDEKMKLPAAVVLSLMLVVRHRENISRLMQGTERRIGGAR